MSKEDLTSKQRDLIEKAYTKYADKIYRYCLSKLSKKEDAEEVLSETFKRLLEQKNIEKIENIQAWVFGIARNVIYERYRQKKYYTYSDYEDYDVTQISGIPENIEDKLAKDEVVELIKNNLQDLDEDAQEIVRLKVWEELKFKEISEVVNQKENTVKTTYYRALKKLNSSVNIDLSRKAVVVDAVVILSGLRVLASSKHFSLEKSFVKEIMTKISDGTQSISIIDKLKKLVTAIVGFLYDLNTVKVAAGVVGAGGLALLGIQAGIVAPEKILNIGKSGCEYKDKFYEVNESVIDEEECEICKCANDGMECDEFQCIENSYESINSLQKGGLQINVSNTESSSIKPLIAVSEPGVGQQVYLYDLEGDLQKSFNASTKGEGINAVIEDINNDGSNEILTSKISGDNTISLWAQSIELENTFEGGESSGFMIDACDFDGDNVDDEVVLGKQDRGQVVLFDSNGKYLDYFTSFANNNGVSVACADLDGDEKDEILVGQLAEENKIGLYESDGSLIKAFSAFIKGEGVLVSSGNLDEDKEMEFLVTKLSGGNEVIKFDSDGSVINYFKPFHDNESDGVNVSTIDLDKDGIDEVVIGKNAGGNEISIFNDNWDLVTEFETEKNISGSQVSAGWMDLSIMNGTESEEENSRELEDIENSKNNDQIDSPSENGDLTSSLKPVIWTADPNSGQTLLAIDQYGNSIKSLNLNKPFGINFSLFNKDDDQISEILLTSQIDNNGFEWLKENGNSLIRFELGSSSGYTTTICDLDGDGSKESILAGKSSARDVVHMDLEGNYKGYFTAFSSGQGANVVCGNLDQDSNDEIIISKKQGGREILVYDSDKRFLRYFVAFTEGDGVFVSVGDIDADWHDEILASKLDGSYIAIYEADGGLKKSFRAFESGSGTLTDAFDIDSDGVDEILVGKLSGGNEILIYEANGELKRVVRGITGAQGSLVKAGWLKY